MVVYGTNQPSEEHSPAPDDVQVPGNVEEFDPMLYQNAEDTNKTTPRKETPDPRDKTSDATSVPPARCSESSRSFRSTTRTISKQLHDSAFGASDEELSELEWTQHPPLAAEPTASSDEGKTKAKAVARKTKNVILDSDEDETIPKRLTRARASKMSAIKKNTMLSDDEIENSSPLAALDLCATSVTLRERPATRSPRHSR